MENNWSSDDLGILLTVIDVGGFRAAASRLGVAPSKVSNTVSRLESSIGAPLILRTTRSVRATEQGQRLAERIRPLFAEMSAACVEAASATGRPRGRLKLNVPGAVVPDVLPPLLSGFQRTHPQIEVEIVMENDMVDIIAAGCDAGIRYGDALQKDMLSVPIGPRTQQIAFAASRAYLQERGRPEIPQDLVAHDAIRYRLGTGALVPWVLTRNGETMTVEPIRRLTLSVGALDSGLSYARLGLGVIGTFRNWLEEDFGAGTLVPLLTEWWPFHEGPRLYYPNRLAAAPLRALIDFCRSA